MPHRMDTVVRNTGAAPASGDTAESRIQVNSTSGALSYNDNGTARTAAELALTQTLTNKTVNLASNTVTGTLAEFNTAVSDANLASLTGAETLTNKTIALGSNTVSGTLAEFNTAVTDANLASLTGSETLTNKTLTGSLSTRSVEVVATTNVIAAAESGTTFFLDLAGGFTSTLPAPAAGAWFKFVVKTAPTTAYIITTNAGANVLQGTVANNGAETEANGIDLANHDTINFVASQAKIGDWIEVVSDGTNWYVSGGIQDFANLTVAVT